MDPQPAQNATSTVAAHRPLNGHAVLPQDQPNDAPPSVNGSKASHTGQRAAPAPKLAPPVSTPRPPVESFNQSFFASAAGLAQQIELLQERRPGLFCLTRSNSLIALGMAIVLAFPIGIFILIVHDTLLGQMFLTSPIIGLAVLILSLTALCSLAIRAIAIAFEWRATKQFRWPDGMPDAIDHQTAGELLRYLEASGVSNSILRKLAIDGLSYFASGKGLADTREFVETQAEHEAIQLHSSFSTINLITWTLPILGFIGTVWGIGLAIGPFAVVVQDASEIDGIKDGLISVIAGLSTAFQTTLLALVASVVVMFPRSAIQKTAEMTLAKIDKRLNRELLCRLVDRVVLDSSDPESLLNAFDELLNKYQRHWDRQTGNMVKTLAQELGSRFHETLAENEKHQSRMMVHFDSTLRSTSEDVKQWALSMSQATQTTLAATAKTTEALVHVGVNADQRLAEIAPGCEQLATHLSALSMQHETFCRTAAMQFSSVNSSFERIGNLLRESNQQMEKTREVQLPEMSNEALIYLRKSLMPFAKIIQQQTEIHRRLLERLESPPVEKSRSTWFSRTRTGNAQLVNSGGADASN